MELASVLFVLLLISITVLMLLILIYFVCILNHRLKGGRGYQLRKGDHRLHSNITHDDAGRESGGDGGVGYDNGVGNDCDGRGGGGAGGVEVVCNTVI